MGDYQIAVSATAPTHRGGRFIMMRGAPVRTRWRTSRLAASFVNNFYIKVDN